MAAEVGVVSFLGPEETGWKTKALHPFLCPAHADCRPTRALLGDRILFPK